MRKAAQGTLKAGAMEKVDRTGGIRRVKRSSLTAKDERELCERPRAEFADVRATVEPIVESVRERGDEGVLDWAETLDGCRPQPLVEDVERIQEPELSAEAKDAFQVAHKNIEAFHKAQFDCATSESEVETMKGVKCRRIVRPIESVGLYVPAGTAVLPSTALMLATPAKVAGCTSITIAVPPRPDGSLCPEVVYAAKIAGADKIVKAGGAQAIAAMAWGTESVPKASKLFGPGNQYVTTAKMVVSMSEALTSIDMPAGPSEVLVIADGAANPSEVAMDLLSQAEHGADSQVVLAALPGLDVEAVESELERHLGWLPRGEMAAEAIRNSICVECESGEDALAFSNKYAPEHLIINVENARHLLPLVDSAGSVFLGPYAPESVGDYASGTNHVLPTFGYAKMYSGVSIDSFVKKMTVQELTKEGLSGLGPHVSTMARCEGLEAHAQAVDIRLDRLRDR